MLEPAPLISVIIPIFNLENFIAKCLENLCLQKNRNFEVIMVNDGSTDNSESICKEFCTIDNRFHLFNKPNGGVSSARNLGLTHAKGTWIAFVDGDDNLDDNFLTIPQAIEDNVDVIEKSYTIKRDDNIIFSNQIKKDSIIYSQDLLKYYSYYLRNNSAALWNKIIRRDVIGDSRFDETKRMGEDLIFFISIFHKIKKYCRSSTGIYHYIKRETSSSEIINSDNHYRIKILFDNLNTIEELTKSSGIGELGVFLASTIYIPYLLRLSDYLSYNDWNKIFRLNLKISCSNRKLLDYQDIGFCIFNTMRLFIKSLVPTKKNKRTLNRKKFNS